ncbi:MAG TPA: alpha/beta hydrolase, partial [Chryseosolibacter sp.]|nr:alpha/beta hydrolase [Chryseosolibacter sp.]
MGQTTIPLYEQSIPNSIPSPNREVNDGGRIANITVPSLTIFLPPPEKSNGCAVVICPGGGYRINAMQHEGFDVARKLNAIGITAFVLKYRIPDDATMHQKEIGPLQDAQQAMRIVRDRSKEWGVDFKRVGILGFSAGGHLASTVGTHL